MLGIILYCLGSAVIMCLGINIALWIDGEFIRKSCEEAGMSVRSFIIGCTLLGFITLPYSIWSALREAFRE